MKDKFKIGVLCHYPFPEGMAATTRIISYGKGLIANGASVEVYSFCWRGDDSSEPLEGTIAGLKYVIPYSYHTRKGKLYHVLIDKYNIYNRIVKRIKESNAERPFDCLLVSTDHFNHYRHLLLRLYIMKIPMAFIGDEFPLPIRMLKEDISLWDKIRYKFYHSFFKKRVVMTEALGDYYNRITSSKPTFILNSVIDETRFEGVKEQVVSRNYICYMGNMQLKKDNVDNIIKAFSLIAPKFPKYDLFLYGTPNANDKSFIEDFINQTGMQNRVFIKGRVDYSEVPQILTNATILVTSQPKTKRAEGGFPTKMGEYMLSHTPMLVTNVGEIHRYVQDGVNTYMVEPDDPQAYANKMSYMLTHPVETAHVADNAYEYAFNHFSAKEATKDLLSFLIS